MPDFRDVTVQFRVGEDVLDINQMRDSSPAGYANYIEPGLFFVDHHEVLRATLGEYPIATTPEQIDALISYLQSVKAKMIAAS